MHKAFPKPAETTWAIGAAFLALLMAQAPAHAGGDVSNFKVKNCTTERMFVCSFDKADNSMKIPYKAAGLGPGDKKEFGCASLGRCKVIIGVSKKKKARTLSEGMKAALATGSVAATAVAGVGTAINFTIDTYGPSAVQSVSYIGAVVGGVVAVAASGALASIEIADGWNDGEVCNQVRRAAENAGMKPRDFMQNGKTYTVVPRYAVNDKGNPYVNADGTAVFAYATKNANSCPEPLKTQLIPD